jgi:hypothetical protein
MLQYVISNRGAGQSGRVRNPLTDLAPANKPQGKSFGRNSKGVPHASAISQTQGFGKTVFFCCFAINCLFTIFEK